MGNNLSKTTVAMNSSIHARRRMIYESLGGRGVVYDETEELSEHDKKEMKAKPDNLLSGVRRSVNGVLIPLRR
jgi:hypothetical protein